MPAAATATLPGTGASRAPADTSQTPGPGLPSYDPPAAQGIWLCGGGELPETLLAALTGQAAWAPRADADEHGHESVGAHGRRHKDPADSALDHPPGAVCSGAGCSDAGFVQGGVLDGLAPGAELAMFLSDAVTGADWPDGDIDGADSAMRAAGECAPVQGNTCHGNALQGNGVSGVGLPGLGRLSDAALTGVMRGWRRLSSWAAAMEHAAVAELAERRIAEAESAGCLAEEAGRYVAAEVAAALKLTRTSADVLVGRALTLARLPATAGALVDGRIDLPRAMVIADGVSCLPERLSHAVEARMAAIAPTRTTGQLRAEVARTVIAADPSAAEQRRVTTEKQARVEHQPEPGGVTAMLAGRDLPTAESIAAANRITALAMALKRDGATGGMDLLRAKVFLGLLLNRPVAALTQATEPGSHTQDSATGSPEAQGPATEGSATSPCAGRSPISFGGGGTWWPASSREARPAASINLTVPLTTWLGLAAAPGDLAGYGPITAATARQILADARSDPTTRWCLTITDDEDRAIGHGCVTRRQVNEGTGTRPRRDGTPETHGSNLTIDMRRLATAECDHWRESAGYQPPRSLRHIVEIRDQTCSFPGCRRPSVKCDKDHTIPYDRGGRTCECNLAPLCRFHHKVKQALGWKLSQPAPGILTWTTPSGWRYTNPPHLLR